MKAAVLFSGGKDSTYAAYLAKEKGFELSCLISIFSKNKASYMFHTPSIKQVKKQAKIMNLPIILSKTKGEKESELVDLEKAIKKAKRKYDFDTLVTGALHSDYQASRIQAICDKLNIKCLNPIWHKEEIPYLKELIDAKFKIVIVGVFAFPLDKSWLGRIIDEKFIEEVMQLKEKYQIHAAGEGGEFETFVLNCPLFKKELKVKSFKDSKEGENSFRREIKVN
ncbi:MAG: diphthine--ammonia ligase [Candidatus Nanoarchaeia archaeon]|nr:diphthine--ammonia ligase [Candidatus Nanoarchaeia archaeon]MDD5357787.1 diphthine--ammonia ligase [Candidatus Nanoarchaeia archaeon]MDD5588706.1 diphthine--ammonia ligase [Candidatus Nanoarchaeia archaeon]